MSETNADLNNNPAQSLLEKEAPPPPTAVITTAEIVFHIAPRYSHPVEIGKGAYGFVISAHDNERNEKVAVKKVLPFEHITECQRTLREIRILVNLRHENIIDMRDLLLHPHPSQVPREVYMILTWMEDDLYKFLTKRGGRILSDEQISWFLCQILRGLKFIHSANIIHRDLKPSNLLVNSDFKLKIGDFGLARIVEPHRDLRGFLSRNVVTLWYRAPEIMWNAEGAYTSAIDLWSVGCIFAEMYTKGKQIFPGQDEVNQINWITAVLGSLSEEELSTIQSENTRKGVVNLFSLREKQDWSIVLRNKNVLSTAQELLDKFLAYDPDSRITAEDALLDPFVAVHHDPYNEPVCEQPFTHATEYDDLTTGELAQKIHQYVVQFQQRREANNT